MGVKFEIEEDVFTISKGDKNIVYAPLKGTFFYASDRFCEFLEKAKKPKLLDTHLLDSLEFKGFLDSLKGTGLLKGEGKRYSLKRNNENIMKNALAPSHVVLLFSDLCNMSCKYCFASAGTEFAKPFDESLAKAAIDYTLKNAVSRGEKEYALSFHGGGEPMLQFGLVKSCVDYAREKASELDSTLVVQPMIVTNGYFSDEVALWLAKNMAHVQISFDGPESIHDDQRPLLSGGKSFDRVFRTVQLLSNKADVLLTKTTISKKYAHKMPEIAEFLCKEIDIDRFHFGAVTNYGRALSTGYSEPEASTFVKYAIEAQEIAEKYKKSIVVSLAQETFPEIRLEYCGVTAPSFSLTGDGDVTACPEVIVSEDKRRERYFYGKLSIKLNYV